MNGRLPTLWSLTGAYKQWLSDRLSFLAFVISILSPPCSLSFLSRSKMGEQLICKTNPTSDLVRKQLSHLKDQWQTLKQTAANQKRALGGAKSLQEFNKKVDKLEAWIKEKVQGPSTTLREKLYFFVVCTSVIFKVLQHLVVVKSK